jgi:hypothetical protein
MLTGFPPLAQWLPLSQKEKNEILRAAAGELRLAQPFALSLDEHMAPRVVIEYSAIGRTLAFRLVPAHSACLGLSERNLAAIHRIADEPQINVEEMTPVIDIDIGPFLIAEHPLDAAAARALIGFQGEDPDVFPAYLDEASALAAVRALGATLPSEIQWEAAAKAGADPLFPFGDELLSEARLEPWMRYDLADPLAARNPFGIGGFFFAEWCADEFTASHAPDAESLPGTRTIKGGAAYFWPWQDEEWVWCLSSMRMPSTDLDKGVAVCRPVIVP